MAARLSPASWADAAGVAAQAEALRERAVQLVDEDAEAYRLAPEARAAAGGAGRRGGRGGPRRRGRDPSSETGRSVRSPPLPPSRRSRSSASLPTWSSSAP